MPQTSQILLIRHGETDDNRQGRFQGHGGSRLNAQGQAQAQRLAERLRPVGIDAVYASDLDRAFETASAIAGTRGLPVVKDHRLREVDVGKWQGLSGEEIAVHFADEWIAWREGRDVPRGGGETYRDVQLRVVAVLTEIVAAHRSRRVAIVSHGGAIKSVVAWLIGGSADAMRTMAPIENTSITLLEEPSHPGAPRPFVVRSFNDVAHLRSL